MLRDVPEPALLVAVLDDERRPLVTAGIAIRAFPIGPHRALVQHRIPDAQAQPVHHHPVLPAGVDHDLGPHLADAVVVLDPDADRPIALEQHVEHAHALVRIHAMLAGVLEHHLIELAAHHLPRLRALVRLVVPEVKRRRLACPSR